MSFYEEVSSGAFLPLCLMCVSSNTVNQRDIRLRVRISADRSGCKKLLVPPVATKGLCVLYDSWYDRVLSNDVSAVEVYIFNRLLNHDPLSLRFPRGLKS